MPIFGGSQFEKLLAKATDESVTEPDWMAMMAMWKIVPMFMMESLVRVTS